MLKLIDTECGSCGEVKIDVFVNGELPLCTNCNVRLQRAWRSAPSIAPNGLRKEMFVGHPESPKKVDTKKIAEDVTFEVKQKWQTHGSEASAELAVGREINHKAGIADEQGNPLPVPTPEPIRMQRGADLV